MNHIKKRRKKKNASGCNKFLHSFNNNFKAVHE